MNIKNQFSKESNDVNNDLQNVQRLGDELNSAIILPRALEDLSVHDEIILKKRQLLIDSGKFKGNTAELAVYKKNPQLFELPSKVKSWTIGLLLGDASIQVNTSGNGARIKIQQAYKNVELLQATRMFLLPWVLSGISVPKTRKIGNQYCELQTISHPVFIDLANIISTPLPDKSFQSNQVLLKQPELLLNHLDYIVLGGWFCTDGGRRDYGKNEGKAIQFHTQGFTQEGCEALAWHLTNKLDLETKSKYDYTSPDGTQRFLLEVHARSFETFVDRVGPYILPNFEKRLPRPRRGK